MTRSRDRNSSDTSRARSPMHVATGLVIFASANGGTLFLDEVGKASQAVQQKLLHAAEYHEIRPVGSDRDVRIDVRVVLAANVSLEDLVENGQFLPDLYARVSTFRIVLPPLRERRVDIPALVQQLRNTRRIAGIRFHRRLTLRC